MWEICEYTEQIDGSSPSLSLSLSLSLARSLSLCCILIKDNKPLGSFLSDCCYKLTVTSAPFAPPDTWSYGGGGWVGFLRNSKHDYSRLPTDPRCLRAGVVCDVTACGRRDARRVRAADPVVVDRVEFGGKTC